MQDGAGEGDGGYLWRGRQQAQLRADLVQHWHGQRSQHVLHADQHDLVGQISF